MNRTPNTPRIAATTASPARPVESFDDTPARSVIRPAIGALDGTGAVASSTDARDPHDAGLAALVESSTPRDERVSTAVPPATLESPLLASGAPGPLLED